MKDSIGKPLSGETNRQSVNYPEDTTMLNTENTQSPSTQSSALLKQPLSAVVRDRIKALRRVPACELLDNPKNWRRHPRAQADALRGLLTEVGYADALIARELPDGRLMLVDGHLRKSSTPQAVVPVLILDVTEQEADKILLTLDPLAVMAESNVERIKALIETVQTSDTAVEALLRKTAGDQIWRQVHPLEEPPAQIDRAGELQEKWQTAPGQLWQIERHKLLCGDSTTEADVIRLMGSERVACSPTYPQL
jgi:hypothetical protein